MIDCHVHLEKGQYTREWLDEFIHQAIKMNIEEIQILEHTHVFKEFEPLYKVMGNYNEYQKSWFAKKKSSARALDDYSCFIKEMKKIEFPIVIKFGLEVCYSPECHEEISKIRSMIPVDFLVGSIHWIDGWAFSHLKQRWSKEDVNSVQIYNKYYDLMEQLIGSRYFDGLAHPNSLQCFGTVIPNELKYRYQKIAYLLKENQMYVEQSSGLALNYGLCLPGMDEDMLRTMIDFGVNILTASDAHYPNQVGAFIRTMDERIKQLQDIL